MTATSGTAIPKLRIGNGAAVSLPPIQLAGGEPREVELRLPPEWDK